MSKLSYKQRLKLGSTLGEIGKILEGKMFSSNNKPVFLKISMNQGGLRSLESFEQEIVSKIQL